MVSESEQRGNINTALTLGWQPQVSAERWDSIRRGEEYLIPCLIPPLLQLNRATVRELYRGSRSSIINNERVQKYYMHTSNVWMWKRVDGWQCDWFNFRVAKIQKNHRKYEYGTEHHGDIHVLSWDILPHKGWNWKKNSSFLFSVVLFSRAYTNRCIGTFKLASYFLCSLVENLFVRFFTEICYLKVYRSTFNIVTNVCFFYFWCINIM